MPKRPSKPVKGIASTKTKPLTVKDSTAYQPRWFYQKNKKLIEHSVNKTFEEILWMSAREFKDWMTELRKVVLEIWDKDGVPPTVGQDEKEIINQFERIERFPVSGFLKQQAGKSNHKIILNTSKIGTAANQWFPTMMKTEINYTSDFDKGVSIYDHFNDEALFPKLLSYGERNFKRDSFYHHSHVVRKDADDIKRYLFSCKTGREWILKFEAQEETLRERYDYWISPYDKDKAYTGYDEKLRQAEFLTISKSDLAKLPIPKQSKRNIKKGEKATAFCIRVFQKGQRVFPVGFKAFRVSLCQYAVNYPPLTAKFLYERYLERLGVEKAIIWDPSSGWGGRILGAMGIKKDFKVHYIGTDPNTDHNTSKGRTKYHELADFYNSVRTGERVGKRKRRSPSEPNTYEIYQCGSEEMAKQNGFKKYKGKVDIVFTSPPYFGKEMYSDDVSQSAIKFSEYDGWREGFLRPTLKTAVEWLRPGGYLLWNIANVKFGNKKLRLEEDSTRILKELGMEWVEVLKMALASMPGANRLDASSSTNTETIINDSSGARTVRSTRGKIKAGHGCWISDEDGIERPAKYEPIFVFRKPGGSKSTKHLALDCAEGLTDLTKDFHRALSGKKVNLTWIRAIYAALEKRISDVEGIDLFKTFNKLRHHDLFIAQRNLEDGRTIIPQFAQRKVSNNPSKKLVGKNVLIQFIETKRGKVNRLFAYGEVLPPESGDNPWNAWVKISNSKKLAEKYWGITMEIKRADILLVESKSSSFLYVDGDWSY
jgi:hypothetical protein